MTHSTSATEHNKAGFYEPISKRLAREREQRASASTAIRKLGAAVRKIKKSAIGSPVAFRHELHVGVDSVCRFIELCIISLLTLVSLAYTWQCFIK